MPEDLLFCERNIDYVIFYPLQEFEVMRNVPKVATDKSWGRGSGEDMKSVHGESFIILSVILSCEEGRSISSCSDGLSFLSNGKSRSRES